MVTVEKLLEFESSLTEDKLMVEIFKLRKGIEAWYTLRKTKTQAESFSMVQSCYNRMMIALSDEQAEVFNQIKEKYENFLSENK